MSLPFLKLLGLGVGALGLPAREVWAMTPRELAAALSARAPASTAMDRAALSALMNRYPDRDANHPRGGPARQRDLP